MMPVKPWLKHAHQFVVSALLVYYVRLVLQVIISVMILTVMKVVLILSLPTIRLGIAPNALSTAQFVPHQPTVKTVQIITI